MRWRLRIAKEVVAVLFLIVWTMIYGFLSSTHPAFPLLFNGIIAPTGIILFHALLLWRRPPPKGKAKWFVVAVLGWMMIPLTGLPWPALGPEGLVFIPIGLLVWAFGIRRAYGPTVRTEVVEAKAQVTPKSFLKRCVKCGEEIPIASEQCPVCGQKQP